MDNHTKGASSNRPRRTSAARPSRPSDARSRRSKRRGGNKGVAPAIVLVLVLIVGASAAGAYALNGGFVGIGTKDAASAEKANEKSASKLKTVRDSSSESKSKKKTAEEKAAEEAEAQRRSELELDPNKQTEWNTTHNNGTNTVYLTFDDGPSANTAKVLDILDTYGAKATFFVTGNDADYRSSIKDAYERGNTIGMHTMTHDYSIYTSEETYFNDLHQVEEVIKEQIGYVPYLVRFPGGSSNTVSRNYCSGIMSKLSQDLVAKGYQYYDWNVSSSDAAGATVDTETIVSSSCVEGYPNVMLLFHDSASKTTTVEALPRIIEFYKERGYEFRAIDRSVWVQHHGIAN